MEQNSHISMRMYLNCAKRQDKLIKPNKEITLNKNPFRVLMFIHRVSFTFNAAIFQQMNKLYGYRFQL